MQNPTEKKTLPVCLCVCMYVCLNFCLHDVTICVILSLLVLFFFQSVCHQSIPPMADIKNENEANVMIKSLYMCKTHGRTHHKRRPAVFIKKHIMAGKWNTTVRTFLLTSAHAKNVTA